MDGPPTPQLLADLLKRVPHVQALRKIGMGTVLSWLAVAAGLVFSALTFQGFRQSAARLRFGALLVIAMYSLQIVLWPFVMGARGATFLLPWTLPWAWAGWRRLRDTRAHLEASVLIAFLIPANLYFSARIAQVSRGGVHSIEPVARWLQENAGDRVLGVDDNLNAFEFALLTGRPMLIGLEPHTKGYRLIIHPEGIDAEWFIHRRGGRRPSQWARARLPHETFHYEVLDHKARQDPAPAAGATSD